MGNYREIIQSLSFLYFIWNCGEILLYLLCNLLVYDLDYIMFSGLLSCRYLYL